MDTAPSEATEQAADAATSSSGDAPGEASPTAAMHRPASVNAIFGILIIAGGGLLGYAVAIAAGNGSGRDYSLMWALLGASLIVTAWGLRGRRWWAAAAAIAVALVGLVAGMLGVRGLLILTNSPGDDRANWIVTVGLSAVGAASIAILGLISSAWGWLTASTRPTPTTPAPGLEAPPAA